MNQRNAPADGAPRATQPRPRSSAWITPAGTTVTGRDVAARRSALLGGIVAAGLLAAIAAGSFLATGDVRRTGSGRPNAALAPAGPPGSTSPAAASPASAGTSAGASPSAVASTRPVKGGAPTSAAGFRLRGTVVQIRFPLKLGTTYSYEDDFLARRVGTPLGYNHAWAAPGSKVLYRAHDGVDISVRTGTPVLAPFDGVVIDPRARWKPWRRDRYGTAAVIESTEPASAGYVAIVAHLSRVTVKNGERVQRGDVVGYTGRTGNAEMTEPHLHFELRAPFRIPVRVAGVVRRVDAFDPYPSLVAADPKRRPKPATP